MARYSLPTLAAACLGFVTSAPAQQLLIVDVQVTGNQRLPTAAVVAASGLATGATVTDKDLNDAVQRLVNTGLFTSLSWHYDPKAVGTKSGIGVTLQVQEAPLAGTVTLDIAGVDEAALWAEIKRENGLIDTQIPASQESTDYYLAAIKTALKSLNHDQDVVSRYEGVLGTNKFAVNFRSANLPVITGIKFEGNRVLHSDALIAALKLVSFAGEGYTQSYVRRLLEANIKPLYEERGHLTVAFTRVAEAPAPGGVTVIASIDEGPEWTLGSVDVSGDAIPREEIRKEMKFPEGKLANWKLIQTGIDGVTAVLQRDGYLGAATEAVRAYHDETHAVDLTLKVDKGQQIPVRRAGVDRSGAGRPGEGSKPMAARRGRADEPFLCG